MHEYQYPYQLVNASLFSQCKVIRYVRKENSGCLIVGQRPSSDCPGGYNRVDLKPCRRSSSNCPHRSACSFTISSSWGKCCPNCTYIYVAVHHDYTHNQRLIVYSHLFILHLNALFFFSFLDSFFKSKYQFLFK